MVLCNPNLTSIPDGDNGSDGTFSTAKIKKVDMTGSGITFIGQNSFRSCHSLGEVIFPPTLKTVHRNCVFYDCTALTNAVFTSCPDDAAAVLKDGGWPFSGNPSMKFRIQICYTHGDWEKAVESLGSTLNKGSAVPGSNDYKTYAANFADYEEVVPLGTINISWNYRWIARYTEKSTDVKFSVTGDPEAQGDGFVNGYGDYGTVTEPMTCTAPACAALDGVAYECDGYVLQQSGDEGWVEVESGEGCTYTFNKTDAGIYRLVWQWNAAGYTLNITEISDSLGTVTVSDPDYRDVYYSAGSKVSVTVTPADGKTFGRWYGASDSTSTTIELTMDGNKSLTPYVAGPWTYDSGAKTVSNGYWTFNTSGSLDALTVTSVKKSGAVTDIDFSTGLEGGAFAGIDGTFYGNGTVTGVKMADTMTTIGSNTFRSTGKLKKVVLSATLKTIGDCSFFSSAVTEVTPFLPDTVTSIIGAAFYGCGSLIVPEFTLGKGFTQNFWVDGTYPIFFNVRFGRIDLSQCGLQKLGNAFQNNGNTGSLTEIVLPKTFTSMENNCFRYQGVHTVVETLGGPFTINNSFAGYSSMANVYVLPKTAEWAEYVAANCTVQNLSDTEKTTFATLFPSVKQAKQKIKLPNDSWQYLVWKPVGGMALIFK